MNVAGIINIESVTSRNYRKEACQARHRLSLIQVSLHCINIKYISLGKRFYVKKSNNIKFLIINTQYSFHMQILVTISSLKINFQSFIH